ncbi:hypothetical protein FB451DRAFT_1476926 [Mycena latifolia]|nr:hypothetical protein FB451DRAFT_1476926 [Mycena latifolia]
MASAFELQIPPDSDALHSLADVVERMWSYECAFFETHLIAKTTPSTIVNSVFYEDTRRLDVRLAGETRKESLARRTDKYCEMAGIKTFPQNETLAWVAMDIEDETLNRLFQGYNVPTRFLGPVFTRIVDLERQNMETRCRTWKNIPTSSSPYLAQAVFAAYPSSQCANDPELFEIMAARGCSVFDFDHSKSPMPLDKILADGPGVSLLRCPEQWLSQLTELAQANPCIMAIEIPNSSAGQNRLEDMIEANRHNWGNNIPIPDRDHVISCFCFLSKFKADSFCMSAGREAMGILLVNTGQAGTFRVTFLHHTFRRSVQLSWSLRTAGSPLHGTIEIPYGNDFRRDSFTLEVPSAGLHQIDIRIDNRLLSPYLLLLARFLGLPPPSPLLSRFIHLPCHSIPSPSLPILSPLASLGSFDLCAVLRASGARRMSGTAFTYQGTLLVIRHRWLEVLPAASSPRAGCTFSRRRLSAPTGQTRTPCHPPPSSLPGKGVALRLASSLYVFPCPSDLSSLLPPSIPLRPQSIIQFFAWFAWFPALFYTTMYITDVYLGSLPPSTSTSTSSSSLASSNSTLPANATASARAQRAEHPATTRGRGHRPGPRYAGARAQLSQALLVLATNIVLPAFIPSTVPPTISPSPASYDARVIRQIVRPSLLIFPCLPPVLFSAPRLSFDYPPSYPFINHPPSGPFLPLQFLLSLPHPAPFPSLALPPPS